MDVFNKIVHWLYFQQGCRHAGLQKRKKRP